MPKKKVLMAVLALIFAVMQILPAFANELEDKQAEYDDVQQKMQQMEIAKERARREAEAASDRMEEIVAELNRLQAEIKEIEAKRDKLQPLIDENQEVLAEKKAKMEGRMKIYRQRLRDIYINGQINYLDVLLGAKDFSDFSSRMFLLQKIISRYNRCTIITGNIHTGMISCCAKYRMCTPTIIRSYLTCYWPDKLTGSTARRHRRTTFQASQHTRNILRNGK
jgi:peptidoglycan hydrolase CwlO-like protein